ncbi:SDR family oxidoreductase [Mesorhizobium sp. CO1-1-8]|uniref:SDR family oxidoreductase n=1 Tax=Mesorhizobium sp. CO1-1-8 TaxID=2876631 RepID=UPI001CD0614D|nr:SDR family oxidoreductase [Mesorhizobium sp. CO1-1-8]MBZ9772216.1 SDR family oxidoreductase [Mesorhizobium sp. CO1-1-8]
MLVTAGGGGAGRGIATHFHAAGAKVLACDVDTAGIRSLEAECPGLLGIVADAGDEASVQRAFDAAVGHMGGVDVLVNNVGIAGPTAAAEDVTLDQWNESLRVNLTSHFLFARAVIPAMKAQGSGLIVNISSGSAKVGLPLRLPYVVTKGAVLSMSMNLARELGPFGIRVNAILPGAIKGARVDRVIKAKAEALGIDPADYERSLLRYISMRTMVDPEDVAAMISFLASPAGSRISGQSIGVDGNIEWEE